MNNEIVLNEDELDGVTASLDSNFINILNIGDAINPNFSGAVNVGLLGNSIGTISNQISSISNTISNTQFLIDEYKNQLLDYDNKMAAKIDDIPMPTDFIANNSSKVNMFTQSILSKIDGKSVNEGSDFSGNYDTFESSINNKVLSDITRDAINNQEYDDSSNLEKENDFNNINNSYKTEIESYDDNSSIEDDFMLIEMIPRDIMDEFSYDEYYGIDQENLSDINNVETFNDSKVTNNIDYSVNKEAISNINNNYDSFVEDEINYYVNKLKEEE